MINPNSVNELAAGYELRIEYLTAKVAELEKSLAEYSQKVLDQACDKGLLRLKVQEQQFELTDEQHKVKVLVDALEWLKLIFTDDTLSQERDAELWLPTVDEALATVKGE